ncbi:MAG: phosphatase PAP2 family protein [Bacteroidales bacterium]
MRYYIILASIFLCAAIHAQEPGQQDVYSFNYKWEIPATVAGYALNFYGLDKLKNKDRLDTTAIMSLDRDKIWWFDRQATYQNPLSQDRSHTMSDVVLNISLLLPIALTFDKEIRADWAKLLFLYLETHALNANLYVWAGPMLNNRIRPFVYNPDVELDRKLEGGTRNAFFSGHTSWTATATFFMAKVYADYHPEIGSKKYWLYAAALIPPVTVGYFRYNAGKHFPTDIITGLAIGAGVGVLIPHLHKTGNHKSWSMMPYFGSCSGLSFTMNF